MTLLHEIQTSLMQEGTGIGPILLKLRFLASRLGSDLLEDWVKHEVGGYPEDVPVPDYRKMRVSYTAGFNGPYGSAINNAPIPSCLIEKFAGRQWTIHEERQSVAAIDDLIQFSKGKGGRLNIDASDLILLLQGNVYPGYACNSVAGFIPVGALVELQSSVRNRILELTIKLEKEIPVVATITVGSQSDAPMTNRNAVTQITNQVIHNTIDQSVNIVQLSPDVGKNIENLRQEINEFVEDQCRRSEALKVVDAIEDQLKSGSPNSTVVDALMKALPPVGDIASIASLIWQALG